MNELENKLIELADELNISETKYEAAVSSYQAVGEYLSTHLDTNIQVFPQGSFRLGTVIKPLSDSDGDYDIDLVCIVDKSYEITNDNARKLKNLIGKALNDSTRYKDMLDPRDGGKRCWTLVYRNDYHLDILPTIKHPTYGINKKLYMTNKTSDSNFEFMTTNPEKFYDWFTSKNIEKKRLLDEAFKRGENIEKVPDYKYRTTLQKTIQVIKRYRDNMFKDDENKPISIIITTIITSIYNGERSIVDLIKSFLNNYLEVFQIDQEGNYFLKNPVNPDENFADKWIIYPERKNNFFKMMNKLKKDFLNQELGLLLEERNRIRIADSMKGMFGENIISKIYENEGNQTKKDRENGTLFLSKEGELNDSSGIKIKDHTFHGED